MRTTDYNKINYLRMRNSEENPRDTVLMLHRTSKFRFLVVKMAKKTWVLLSCLFWLKIVCVSKYIVISNVKSNILNFYDFFSFRNPPMLWNGLQGELLLREAILIEPYLYKQGSRERENAWTRIAESLNSMEEPKFYVSQRSVR